MKRTPLKRKTGLRRKQVRRTAPKPRTQTQVLDDLVRQIVLLRDDFRCQRCHAAGKRGPGGQLHVAHVMPKGQYPAMRHELKNVMLMCYRCHMHWWHKNPAEAMLWLENLKGEQFVNWLRMTAHTRKKVDKAALRLYLQEKLEKFQGGIQAVAETNV